MFRIYLNIHSIVVHILQLHYSDQLIILIIPTGVARVDLVKLREEIATIEAALATEQSFDDSKNNDVANLQIRLEELQRKLPYSHSGSFFFFLSGIPKDMLHHDTYVVKH